MKVHHSVGREKARAIFNGKSFCDPRGGGDGADPLDCFTQLEAVAIGKINNARDWLVEARKEGGGQPYVLDQKSLAVAANAVNAIDHLSRK
jgi:hypothetical protein